MGDDLYIRLAASGGDREAVTAITTWIQFVREQHHGWKFGSERQLAATLDAMDEAVRARQLDGLRRAGKRMIKVFRATKYTYWPRLRLVKLWHDELAFNVSPAWCGTHSVLYPGQVYLHVVVRQRVRGWTCGVVMSGLRVEEGETAMFPAFDGILREPGCHWQLVETPPRTWRVRMWPTIIMPDDVPDKRFPT